MWLLDTQDNDTPTLTDVPEADLEHDMKWNEDIRPWWRKRPSAWQGKRAPKVWYAILSHTWAAASEEVTFEQIRNGTFSRNCQGWYKIQQGRRQAAADRYDYIWVDTCCIDKKSSAELQEAINSMYNWYKRAGVCYVHMPDVNIDSLNLSELSLHRDCQPFSEVRFLTEEMLQHLAILALCLYNEWSDEVDVQPIRNTFTASRWFTRGWTLQELLAPGNIWFFDCEWRPLGNKRDLRCWISIAAGIDRRPIVDPGSVFTYSIANRMSWYANRQTSRTEDMAYSLMGTFDVNTPMLYGEGVKAFARLQEEILKRSDDQSILCWTAQNDPYEGDVLALDPRYFKGSSRNQFDEENVPWSQSISMVSRGFEVGVKLRPWTVDVWAAGLNCFQWDDDDNQLEIIMFLQKFEDGTYDRVLLDGKGWTEAEPHSELQAQTVRINRTSKFNRDLASVHDRPYGYRIEDSLSTNIVVEDTSRAVFRLGR